MRFLLVGTMILLLSACLSEPDCIITATNEVKISLKKITSDSVNFVKFTSIVISGSDIGLIFKDSVSNLQLPVNPRSNQTTFTFQYKKKAGGVFLLRTDSVTVGYTIQHIIVSPTCGQYTFFSNLKVLSTSFINPTQSNPIANPKVVNNQLSTSVSVPTNLQIKL